MDGALPGAVNMDRDRALWRWSETDSAAGVRLRVYGWEPAALSLGFHQAADAVDRAALAAAGVDLVRRPTGGAAVLHVDEITYAVSAPLGTEGLGRGVLEIHGAIAEALITALAALGIDARRGGGGTPRDFACFAAAGGHEITVDGRKLVGSALRRGRRGFVQHGSLLSSPAHLDLVRFVGGMGASERERERDRLARKTCSLCELDARGIDRRAFAHAFSAALATRAGLSARAVDGFDELVGQRIP